jgi:hypothetical protein
MGGGNGDRLNAAIALYIDGEYERAAEKLLELTATIEDDDDLRTAHLYLGRSYMSLGDYVKAADAFSRGRSLGGGVEFDEHLAAAQHHLRAEPGSIGLQPLTTRAQLAALIDNLFGQRLGIERGAAEDSPPDVEGHWAKGYIARVRGAGVMRTLADGRFHPDAPVTYPAFYVTVLRLSGITGVPRSSVGARFPDGWAGVLADGDWIPGHPRATPFVSGRDAEDILRSLVDASPDETSE